MSLWNLIGASLMVQMVKNLSAMQETVLLPGLGRSPGEGDDYPLLPGEFHGQRAPVSYSLWGHKESDMAE